MAESRPLILTGLTAFLVAFLVLLKAGYPDIVGNTLPLGDLAADTLLVRRATHGLLLTGHYSYHGVHHPGPYMLYMRAVGEWLMNGLAPGVAGSPYGAHIVGGILNNALFMGLIVIMLVRLMRGEGIDGRRAAMLALAALLPLLLGMGTFGLALWMPFAIVLPFACLLLSVLLLWRGSAGALVIASFCTAALVHAYIPMALIASALWLSGVVIGARRRRATQVGSFPGWAWWASGLIILLFMAPMVLDMVLNPPGNIVLIFQKVAHAAAQTSPTMRMLLGILVRGVLWLPHSDALLALVVGGAALALAGWHRALWRDLLFLAGGTVLLSLLAFSRAPTPARDYWGAYASGGLLLAAALGFVCLTMLSGRWRWGPPLILAGSVLGAAILMPVSAPPQERVRDTRSMADWVVSQLPPGGRVELLSARQKRDRVPTGAEKAMDVQFLTSLFVELDWRGVPVCHRNPDAAIVVTPEFICGPEEPGHPARVFEFLYRDADSDCGKDVAMTWIHQKNCIAARPVPEPGPAGQGPR